MTPWNISSQNLVFVGFFVKKRYKNLISGIHLSTAWISDNKPRFPSKAWAQLISEMTGEGC
jgi:hypothetical protein